MPAGAPHRVPGPPLSELEARPSSAGFLNHVVPARRLRRWQISTSTVRRRLRRGADVNVGRYTARYFAISRNTVYAPRILREPLHVGFFQSRRARPDRKVIVWQPTTGLRFTYQKLLGACSPWIDHTNDDHFQPRARRSHLAGDAIDGDQALSAIRVNPVSTSPTQVVLLQIARTVRRPREDLAMGAKSTCFGTTQGGILPALSL